MADQPRAVPGCARRPHGGADGAAHVPSHPRPLHRARPRRGRDRDLHRAVADRGRADRGAGRAAHLLPGAAVAGVQRRQGPGHAPVGEGARLGVPALTAAADRRRLLPGQAADGGGRRLLGPDLRRARADLQLHLLHVRDAHAHLDRRSGSYDHGDVHGGGEAPPHGAAPGGRRRCRRRHRAAGRPRDRVPEQAGGRLRTEPPGRDRERRVQQALLADGQRRCRPGGGAAHLHAGAAGAPDQQRVPADHVPVRARLAGLRVGGPVRRRGPRGDRGPRRLGRAADDGAVGTAVAALLS